MLVSNLMQKGVCTCTGVMPMLCFGMIWMGTGPVQCLVWPTALCLMLVMSGLPLLLLQHVGPSVLLFKRAGGALC